LTTGRVLLIILIEHMRASDCDNHHNRDHWVERQHQATIHSTTQQSAYVVLMEATTVTASE